MEYTYKNLNVCWVVCAPGATLLAEPKNQLYNCLTQLTKYLMNCLPFRPRFTYSFFFISVLQLSIHLSFLSRTLHISLCRRCVRAGARAINGKHKFIVYSSFFVTSLCHKQANDFRPGYATHFPPFLLHTWSGMSSHFFSLFSLHETKEVVTRSSRKLFAIILLMRIIHEKYFLSDSSIWYDVALWFNCLSHSFLATRNRVSYYFRILDCPRFFYEFLNSWNDFFPAAEWDRFNRVWPNI